MRTKIQLSRNFPLADDEKGIKNTDKMTSGTDYDVWGQANPRETG